MKIVRVQVILHTEEDGQPEPHEVVLYDQARPQGFKDDFIWAVKCELDEETLVKTGPTVFNLTITNPSAVDPLGHRRVQALTAGHEGHPTTCPVCLGETPDGPREV